MNRMSPRSLLISAAAAASLTASASAVLFPSDLLPPPTAHYVNTTDSITFLGGLFVLRNIDHFQFTNSFPPPIGGATTTHSFLSTVNADVSLSGGPFTPITGNAACTVKVTHTGTVGPTSTFNTEMLQLDISGGSLPAGVMLRESPTLQSNGQTTITSVGGGLFQIDSFFDIFTELTIDGGQNWNPGTVSPGGPGERVTILPAPSAGLALLGMGLFAKRRRRA